jgi:hypothetical protein
MNRVERNLLWLSGGTVAAAAVTWIAFGLQQAGFAPAVAYPLLVGAALGACLAAIARWLGAPGARTAVAGAVVWGLLVVVGQDYIGHRHRVRQFIDELATQNSPAALAVGGAAEPTFADHLAAVVGRAPWWWSLELVLTATAAAAVTAWGRRSVVSDGATCADGPSSPDA